MDKQELIKKIKDISLGAGDHGDTKNEHESEYALIAYILDLVNRLDEPQKVKVPAFVAEWFETNKYVLDRAILDYMFEDYASDDSEFGKWFDNKNGKPIETLVRMLDGYEVEEEPKWVVKIEDNGSAYFVDFFDELQPHLVCGLSGEVMRFDSEDKANAIVTLIECGTVEQVEV